MRNLTVGDLKLALRDLIGANVAELRKSQTGSCTRPGCDKQKALEAIPEGAARAMPLADELANKDAEHDGLGAAIHDLCLAVEAHPKLRQTVRAASKETRETFVPQLGLLRRPYADEAAAALKKTPELARHKTELKSLAAPGGGTLANWAKDFLQAGDAIDELRSATVGLLG